jgi:hypothetical protein
MGPNCFENYGALCKNSVHIKARFNTLQDISSLLFLGLDCQCCGAKAGTTMALCDSEKKYVATATVLLHF